MSLIITEPRGLGYLEIDQRNVAAPMPPGVARHFECDTYTCSHCQRVEKLIPSPLRVLYKCAGCSRYLCDGCAAKKAAGAPCRTYAQFVEEMQETITRQIASGIILP